MVRGEDEQDIEASNRGNMRSRTRHPVVIAGEKQGAMAKLWASTVVSLAATARVSQDEGAPREASASLRASDAHGGGGDQREREAREAKAALEGESDRGKR